MKFGVRVVRPHWACQNGGGDFVGTEEEMRALALSWRTDLGQPPGILYDVLPYFGEEGAAPPVPYLRVMAAAAALSQCAHPDTEHGPHSRTRCPTCGATRRTPADPWQRTPLVEAIVRAYNEEPPEELTDELP
jgi:hypothetical protein